MFTTTTQVLGSSETARGKSWQWLIGFIETQGCLGIIKRKPHGAECLSLSISRPLKDTQILYHIKCLLGYGHVKLSTVGKYYVANREALANILPLKCSSGGGWFAGLIDGGGVFLVTLKHNPKAQEKKNVSFSLAISQAEGFVLGPLLEKLGGRIRKNGKDHTFIWEVKEKKALIRAVRLLKKHPLRTKRRVDFLKWCKALELTNYKSGLRYSPNRGESLGWKTHQQTKRFPTH
uniref:Homing endonuclease n=1 Tax=Halcampoides purpureus TaxID=2268653 RepID=A0A0U2E2Y7_9CNID|nr:homing endonuclease [Halcampoides purpureus]AKQ50934.1 homing endonuclease [Halcampoides purpureus]